MKLKRTSKLLAILLTLVMVVSLLPMTALAADPPADDEIQFIIDMTEYTHALQGNNPPTASDFGTGTYIYSLEPNSGSETFEAIESGKKQTYTYKADENGFYSVRIEPDSNYPIEKWEINGTTYTIDPKTPAHQEKDLTDLGNSVYLDLTAADSIELMVGYGTFDYHTPGQWTIKPVIEAEEVEFIIDMTEYTHTLQGNNPPTASDFGTGTYIYSLEPNSGSETFEAIESGKKQTYTYKADENGFYSVRIEPDSNYPIEKWEINGTTYTIDPKTPAHQEEDLTDLGNSVYLDLTAADSIELMVGYGTFDYHTPGQWTIKPVTEDDGIPTPAEDEVMFYIDLSAYPYTLQGNNPPTGNDFGVGTYVYAVGDAETIEAIEAGKKQTYTYKANENVLYDVRIALDPDYPVEKWEINGTTYTVNPKTPAHQQNDLIDLGNDVYLDLTEEGVFDLMPGLTSFNYQTPGLWTIKPVIEQSSSTEFTATADTADESMGTAAAERTGKNKYMLTATPADGYVFVYWLKDGDEDTAANRIYGNPYTVELTADATYVAHFQKIAPTLLDGATLFPYQNYQEGINVAPLGRSQSTPVGSRAKLSVPFSVPMAIRGASIAVTVKSGDDVIAARTLSGNTYQGNSNQLDIILDPVPAGVSSLTVTATLTTAAGEGSDEKTYTGFTFEESETNSDFVYIKSPAQQGGTGGFTTENGIDVNGSCAALDAETSALTLYFYGRNGVYSYVPGADAAPQAMNNGLSFEISSSSVERGVFALGSDGEGGLIAAVETLPESIGTVTTPGYDSSVTGAKGSHFLWRWNGESWSRIENSCFSYYPPSGAGIQYSNPQIGDGCRIVLICSASDIWTDRYHWNGTGWEAHNYTFASFFDSTEGKYAVDADGNRWKYDGGAWTQASALTAPEVDQRVYYGGTTWQDANGEWYLIVPGRIHKVTNSYQGSDVYKWNGSRWVYQIMTDFNDPNDDPLEGRMRIRPDAVSTLISPSAGVSVLCGGRGAGALYLALGDATITFDTNGGSEIAPLTQQIGSAVTPPTSPTKDGWTFAGWYLSNRDIAMGNAPYTWSVMPGADITLYAKWREVSSGGTTEDPFAVEKEQAKQTLADTVARLNESDYDAAVWQQIQDAYTAGAADIDAATDYNGVYNALNAAIADINELAKQAKGTVTVAVSMDANTLGLGYIIEPTLVTVDKGTQASTVITELLSAYAEETYGVTQAGLIQKQPPLESMSTIYPWASSGSVESAFYLSDVYFPEQTGYVIPQTLADFIARNQLVLLDEDKDGKYLGEFDYLNTSGWVYSIGDKDAGGASFPGVGANGWMLADGEVMRWQFTLAGYGADVGADNTQWGTQSILQPGDKSALTWKVAEINAAGEQAKYGDAYDEAVAVLTDAESTQAEVDAALAALDAIDAPAGGASGGASGGSAEPAKTEAGEDGSVPAADIAAAAEADKALAVETENGTVTLPAEAVKALAESGEDVTVTVTENDDGTTTVDVAVGGETADVDVKVALDAPGEGQVLVIVHADGTEEVVKKSVVEDGKVYAEIPAGATVKVVDNEKTFPDVAEDAWYADAVEFAASHELFAGTDKGFEPAAPMTRAMLAAVLYRLEDATAEGTNPFADVPDGTWYTDAVTWASAEGIVAGTDKGFEPNANITREQIAAMLYRYAKAIGLDMSASAELSAFPDGGDVADWASEAMQWAVGVGLFHGNADGSLNPKGDATRAEVATLLTAMVKLIVK